MNADAVFAEMRTQSRPRGKRLVAIKTMIMVLLLQLAKRVAAADVSREMHLFLDRRPVVERGGGGGGGCGGGGRGGGGEGIGKRRKRRVMMKMMMMMRC